MKAVLDTNVIFSSLWRRGSNPSLILDALWRGEFTAILTPDIQSELLDVLTRPKLARRLNWTTDDAVSYVAALATVCSWVETIENLGILHDESDNRLLEAAMASKADYIVSGDGAVRALGTFEGTQCVSPAEFVAILEGAKSP